MVLVPASAKLLSPGEQGYDTDPDTVLDLETVRDWGLDCPPDGRIAIYLDGGVRVLADVTDGNGGER